MAGGYQWVGETERIPSALEMALGGTGFSNLLEYLAERPERERARVQQMWDDFNTQVQMRLNQDPDLSVSDATDQVRQLFQATVPDYNEIMDKASNYMPSAVRQDGDGRLHFAFQSTPELLLQEAQREIQKDLADHEHILLAETDVRRHDLGLAESKFEHGLQVAMAGVLHELEREAAWDDADIAEIMMKLEAKVEKSLRTHDADEKVRATAEIQEFMHDYGLDMLEEETQANIRIARIQGKIQDGHISLRGDIEEHLQDMQTQSGLILQAQAHGLDEMAADAADARDRHRALWKAEVLNPILDEQERAMEEFISDLTKRREEHLIKVKGSVNEDLQEIEHDFKELMQARDQMHDLELVEAQAEAQKMVSGYEIKARHGTEIERMREEAKLGVESHEEMRGIDLFFENLMTDVINARVAFETGQQKDLQTHVGAINKALTENEYGLKLDNLRIMEEIQHLNTLTEMSHEEGINYRAQEQHQEFQADQNDKDRALTARRLDIKERGMEAGLELDERKLDMAAAADESNLVATPAGASRFVVDFVSQHADELVLDEGDMPVSVYNEALGLASILLDSQLQAGDISAEDKHETIWNIWDTMRTFAGSDRQAEFTSRVHIPSDTLEYAKEQEWFELPEPTERVEDEFERYSWMPPVEEAYPQARRDAIAREYQEAERAREAGEEPPEKSPFLTPTGQDVIQEVAPRLPGTERFLEETRPTDDRTSRMADHLVTGGLKFGTDEGLFREPHRESPIVDALGQVWDWMNRKEGRRGVDQ